MDIYTCFLVFYMNTPSLGEINKTAKMDPNSITRFYQLKLMNDFMNIKNQNPKMKQCEIASQLKMSTSSIQRGRKNVNVLSPCRINSNNVKKQSKKIKIDDNGDLNRPQMTSKDNKKTKTKNNLKGGSVEDDIVINEHYLDKILKNINT